MLGDTGANHPDNWEGGLNSADLHAIIILFARDEAARLRSTEEHQAYLAQFSGVRRLSYLDVAAVAPFTYAHDHFGYRDQISQLAIEGSGFEPTPGSGAPIKPGEFILGYVDETGLTPDLPRPEILSRNGSYMAYRRLQGDLTKILGVFLSNGKRPPGREGEARPSA